MPLASNGKSRSNSTTGNAPEKPTPHAGGNEMTAAAAADNKAAIEPKCVSGRVVGYNDVPTKEQLAVIDEIVGPVNEDDYEDIRQRRW